jgi:phenylalanine ammonia-lyase
VLIIVSALDLRALQHELSAQISHIISEELAGTFGASLGASELNALAGPVTRAVFASIERTSTMDAVPRMEEAAGCAVRAAIEHLTVAPSTITELPLAPLQSFKGRVGSRAADALIDLRRAYLSGEKGPAPASHYLRGTRSLYEFVRLELGVKMHGSENMNMFEDGLGVEDVTIGENISIIYEVCHVLASLLPSSDVIWQAIRDGRMHSVVANLFQ